MESLQKLNMTELRNSVVELRRKLAEIRFDKASGKLVDTSVPRKKRKELARVLTQKQKLEALAGK
jgi:ribosomal protein L29